MTIHAERITVEALVARPVEHVWRCWTDPIHIVGWNFASDDWCCPSAENDLRVGGKYKARMEAKDGSFGFEFEAVYDEVSLQRTLAYTMADGRMATTRFATEGGSTGVTTVFDAEHENPVAMQHEGWQAILDNFKAYAEAA